MLVTRRYLCPLLMNLCDCANINSDAIDTQVFTEHLVSGLCKSNHGFIFIMQVTVGEIKKMHSKLWSENLKGRDHSRDLGVDGRIMLEWILWK